MITCRAASQMIDAGATGPGLREHLQRCPACGARRALWVLLGEARAIAPSPAFTSRLLKAMRTEGARTGRRVSRRGRVRPLDEFSDFPPGSFGQLLFGTWQGG